MIGEGLKKMKVADLKQKIKQFNRRQKKPEMKIKGYGKMKKQQLLANVLEKIDIRDLMNFGHTFI